MSVSLEELSYVRDGRAVLKSVTATIPDSALTCLVGPNGAGKTTLLRILAGELKATSGNILMDGVDLASSSPVKMSRRFSVIPQGIQPPPHLTVSELVSLARFNPRRALWWRLSGDDREIVHACLRRCQVNELADRRVEELSGGEQRRAWLAFGLAQHRRFLLLDETLDGLDFEAKRSFFKVLKEAAEEGRGVVLTSHDLDLVSQFADSVVALVEGRIVYDGQGKVDLPQVLCGCS